MPNLYVIAGCNGAGKTTASKTISKAVYRLVVETTARNGTLVVGDDEGGFKQVAATELSVILNKRYLIPLFPHDTPAPY